MPGERRSSEQASSHSTGSEGRKQPMPMTRWERGLEVTEGKLQAQWEEGRQQAGGSEEAGHALPTNAKRGRWRESI